MRKDGTWCIQTETGSMYVLDLDNGTVARVPDHDAVIHADLRRDCDTLELLGLAQEPVVGGPLVMLIEPLDPDADVTIRMTSAITEIKELDNA